MKKTIAAVATASALVLIPAGLAEANNGSNGNGRGACVQLGEIHSGLARAGAIPGDHRPGDHRGMAGLCFGN